MVIKHKLKIFFFIYFNRIRFMPFNATLNDISVIGRGNRRKPPSQWQIDHIKLYRIHHAIDRILTHNFSCELVLGTDCTCSCKSNYHMITTTVAPFIPIDHICSVMISMIVLSMVDHEFELRLGQIKHYKTGTVNSEINAMFLLMRKMRQDEHRNN